tara:strand:- start:15 stop:635 length:621 start_codon:yes stop_codon:yes gene_type:complete
MAIFDKKLRSIANTIKDEYIKKYVLEFFLSKISDLAPHTNSNKKFNYLKKVKSLETTKKYFNDSKSLSAIELKEFSLLYLLMNNLDLMRENLHLIENVNLFSEINKQIFSKVISKLKLNNEINLKDLEIDDQLIEKINKFAPIKYILGKKNKDEHEIIELLDDIKRDLNSYNLELRIQELESKFSKDLSETTFNELKELKKKQNIN